MNGSGMAALLSCLSVALFSIFLLACNIESLVADDGNGAWKGRLLHMKLVDREISDSELKRIKGLGFSVLNGEWGMDAMPAEQLLALLDRMQAHGLRFIVNFSDGAAWGYAPGVVPPPEQAPRWQGERVKAYLAQIVHHPAIYAYDISNEAGENLPNGARIRITLDQMRQAVKDVRAVDGKRPILVRMRYWDDEDGDFNWRNPFGPGIADIVMLNLYSNYSLDGERVLLPNMVGDSAQQLMNKILAVDGGVRIWISLATFADPPSFLKPAVTDVRRDTLSASALPEVESIGFFGWGSPSRAWYLPRDGADLLGFLGASGE